MNKLSHFVEDEKKALGLLLLVWGAIQLAAYFLFTMRASCDTSMYISNAELLLEGKLPQGREFLYSAFGVFIAIPISLGLAPAFALWFNVLFAALALVHIYRLSYLLSGNNKAAFVAGLLYAC